MITGKIKTWHAERGFGFIKRDDGAADAFVHIKHVNGLLPQEGLRVQFEMVADERSGRDRADNVRAAP